MTAVPPTGRPDEAALFEQLCELPPHEQSARLDALVRDAPALAARLRRLLALDVAYGAHTARSVVPPQAADPLGDVSDVGPFRLVKQIGRGGMGVVYLAERRDNFAQQVAIKLMPRFAADDAGRERFARERRLLAQLRHPHICSILDGGELGDGTPWLAMALVHGESLCAWCAAHEATLETRIELFLQLCDAVQYAHRNLVIHRDIKDSNVLVDEHGDVRLLDFGIARAIDTDNASEHTAAQDLVFSPMTAAPEQIRGERGTVAIDIYGLGVLLHRLLTGLLPFERMRGDALEIQRAILERVPPRMSDALQQALDARDPAAVASVSPTRLRGELDAVVAHCLRKAPDERYPDVADLARDLQAWRTGHPLSISDNDRLYRLGKFLRRHRTAAIFSTLALIGLLGSLTVMRWEATQLQAQRDEARAARARADIDRDRARAVADFMRSTFEQADPGKASGDALLARDLIERGKRRLGDLDAQPEVQADLALLMAENEAGLHLYQKSATTYAAYRRQIDALTQRDPDVRWRALALQSTVHRELDADSPALDAQIEALSRLANTPQRQARVARERERLLSRRSAFGEAARTLEDAWNRLGAQLPADDALRLRIDLGFALLSAKRLDDGQRVIDAIDRTTLWKRDPELQVLAWRLIVRDMDQRHEPLDGRVRAIAAWRGVAERFYGTDSLEAANTYVWTVGVTEDPAAQDALMQRAYAIQREKMPPETMDRARVEYNMAIYFLELRHARTQAEPHMAQAVKLGRIATSRAHGDVRTFELTWAKTLNALGRPAQCLAELDDPPGAPGSPSDAEKLGALDLELAKAALALDRPAKARERLDAVAALWARQQAPMPPTQADALDELRARLGDAR